MRTYQIITIGCKVAQYEAQQIHALLQNAGFKPAEPDTGHPDLAIVNSCAVTANAAAKSRHALNSLAKRHPDATLVLLGCYAAVADPSLKKLPNLARIADHREGILPALADLITRRFEATAAAAPTAGSSRDVNAYANADSETHSPQKGKDIFPDLILPQFTNRHRAILKVQDGCDARCSYCLIPTLRPKLTSTPPHAALDQARRFIDAGHREIVLSGVFLGAWQKKTCTQRRFDDAQQPLVDLVSQLLDLPGLGRLRLSSLEPGDMTDPLADLLTHHPRAAQHVHLPLQHGCDAILTRMGRQYRSAEYLHAIDRLKKHNPYFSFTTDIIVGFPGETDADFDATLRVAQIVGFTKIHIFSFSPRAGTVAARWTRQRPAGDIVRRRRKQLADLQLALGKAFRERFIGRTVRVLVESVTPAPSDGTSIPACQKEGPVALERTVRAPVESVTPAPSDGTSIPACQKEGPVALCRGLADEYFTVTFSGPATLDNRLVTVRIDRLTPAYSDDADDATAETSADAIGAEGGHPTDGTLIDIQPE